MNEEMIFDIIDDVAAQAKVIIRAHLQQHELSEVLKQSAKEWDEVGEKMRKVFRELEDDVREYFDGKKFVNEPSEAIGEFRIGNEIVFIGNGCAIKDRISRVLVETEMGYQVYVEDAFSTMDELVEHLKQHVHG